MESLVADVELHPFGAHFDINRAEVWSCDADAEWDAGISLWIQLDLDTGEVRLRVNDEDFGVVHTLAPGFPRPLHPTFLTLEEDCAIELLHP